MSSAIDTKSVNSIRVLAADAIQKANSGHPGFLTDGITEERAKQFAKWVETKIPTAGNHRGSAAYRTRLTGALCYRLTKKIGEEQA